MSRRETAISLILNKHVHHICFTITAFSRLSTVFIFFTPHSSLNAIIWHNPYGAQITSFVISLALWFGCALLAHITECYRTYLTLSATEEETIINFFISQSTYSFYVFILQLKYITPFIYTKTDMYYRNADVISTTTYIVSLITLLLILLSLPCRFAFGMLSVPQTHTHSCPENSKEWLKSALITMWNETINPDNNKATMKNVGWIYTFFVTIASIGFADDLILYLHNSSQGVEFTAQKAADIRIMMGLVSLGVTMLTVVYSHTHFNVFELHVTSKLLATLWTGFYILVQVKMFEINDRVNRFTHSAMDTAYVYTYVIFFLTLSTVETYVHYLVLKEHTHTLDEPDDDNVYHYTFCSLLLINPCLYLALFFVLIWLPYDIRIFEMSIDALTLTDHSTWFSPIFLLGILAMLIVLYSFTKYKQIFYRRNYKRTLILLVSGWLLKVASAILVWFIIQMSLPAVLFAAQNAHNVEFCNECTNRVYAQQNTLVHASKINDVNLNETTVYGLTKSYRQKTLFANFIPAWSISHAPLSSQLSMGLREIELHVHFHNQNGNFLIYNIDILDAKSSCNCLKSCIQELNNWHLLNKWHSLIVVRIIPSGIIYKYRWCSTTSSSSIVHIQHKLQTMIDVIKTQINPSALFTPAHMDVGIDNARMWPKASALRDKFMFIWSTENRYNTQSVSSDTCRHAYETLPNQKQNHILFTEISKLVQLTRQTCCIRSLVTQHTSDVAIGKRLGLLTRLKLSESIDTSIEASKQNPGNLNSAFSVSYEQVMM